MTDKEIQDRGYLFMSLSLMALWLTTLLMEIQIRMTWK